MNAALDPVFAEILAWLIALLFASAALHKVSDFRAFLGVVTDYRICGRSLARIIAPLVIVAECAVVLLLLLGAKQTGALLAVGLLASYGGGVALNLSRGRTHIDCGCRFGRSSGVISHTLVWRNLGLIALASVLLLPVTPRAWTGLDIGALIFGVLALALLYLALEALIRNHQSWQELTS